VWLGVIPMPNRLLLAFCALLAACATPATDASGEARWRDEQLADVLRRHAPRAAAAVFPDDGERQAVRVEAQDPVVPAAGRRIDQREPQGLGIGPRSFQSRDGRLVAGARFGLGSVAVDVPGSRLDDRADAAFAALTLDGGQGAARGAGLHVETTGAGRELFADRRINDGAMPAFADASLVQIDAFPHVRFETLPAGAFVAPLRVGAFLDWTRIDHERAAVEREWLSAGPRLTLEPTLRLFGEPARGVDLLGRLGGDLGAAWFRESFRGGDDGDRTLRWAGEASLALRGTFGALQAEVGGACRHVGYDDIDSELYGDRDRTWFRQQQLFVALRATF
jgi:hypothetical protein